MTIESEANGESNVRSRTPSFSAKSAAVARMPGLRALDGLMLALFLAPGALLGGWIGAGLTHRIPSAGLRIAVNLLLTAAGLRLLLG